MELGPQNHNGDGRLGPNSIVHNSSVYGPSGLEGSTGFYAFRVQGAFRV